MRKIFPEGNYTELVGKDSDIVKKEDLLPIMNQLNEAQQAIQLLQDALQTYKIEMSGSVNTNVLNATNAAIQNLSALQSDLESATVENLTVDTLATITTLATQIANISTSISAPFANINEISTLSLEAAEAAISSLEATTATFDELVVSEWNIDNATIAQKLEATTAELGTAEIGTLEVDTFTDNGNASVGGDLSVTGDATVAGLIADEISTENIHWKGTVALSDVQTLFLEIPHFENGQYYVQLLDNTTPFATLEIFNSVDNYFVRWSQGDFGYIQKLYKYGTGTAAQIFIELSNESGNALTMKYATTCATPNVTAPLSYTSLPITPDVTYNVLYKDGSKFFKNVDLAQQGGTIGTLRILPSDNWSGASGDSSYDTSESVDVAIYLPDQELNKDSDVKFHEVDATILGVRQFYTTNFFASELETIHTIDLSKVDDGGVVVIRQNSTAVTNQPSGSYIKQTINGTAVMFPIAPIKDAPNSTTNKPLIWDATNKAIVQQGDITVDSITVSGDAVIHGDLWVDGVTHTTTEESISTSSDVVVLRQNNNSTLGATYAGMLVHKYNGTSDLALVTDSDGTLRVGTGTGADTTYANIYWDDDTEKWYSDSALTTEVTPTGTLTSWDTLEVLGDVKHYTNAVFTVINFNGLVPLLARDEETNLNNKGVMYWDSSNKIAKSTGAPNNGQILGYDNNTYGWVDQSKNFVFATMADYTAAASSVPNGSLVIITDESNYLIGDNQ